MKAVEDTERDGEIAKLLRDAQDFAQAEEYRSAILPYHRLLTHAKITNSNPRLLVMIRQEFGMLQRVVLMQKLLVDAGHARECGRFRVAGDKSTQWLHFAGELKKAMQYDPMDGDPLDRNQMDDGALDDDTIDDDMIDKVIFEMDEEFGIKLRKEDDDSIDEESMDEEVTNRSTTITQRYLLYVIFVFVIFFPFFIVAVKSMRKAIV